MIKVGIIGTPTYENKIKVKEIIHNLKQKYKENVEIVSRGGSAGAEKYVRKFALEFGLRYKEFNPSHTNSTIYSAMNESFYGKPYKPFNFILRDKIFSDYVDVCFCLTEKVSNPTVKFCLVDLEKKKKKYVIVD